jgi:hypothetical protein
MSKCGLQSKFHGHRLGEYGYVKLDSHACIPFHSVARIERNVCACVCASSRPWGETMARWLPRLSSDLLCLIVEYAFYAAADDPNVQMRRLFSFGFVGNGVGQLSRGRRHVACAPDGRIWVTSENRLSVFAENGRFLFRVARNHIKCPLAIAFDSVKREAFVTDMHVRAVIVCSLRGKFIRRFKILRFSEALIQSRHRRTQKGADGAATTSLSQQRVGDVSKANQVNELSD